MSVYKSGLRRLERRFAPKLSYEAYMDAVHRHYDRLLSINDHILAPLKACVEAIKNGTPITNDLDGSIEAFPFPPEEARAWKRDDDLMDAYELSQWGEVGLYPRMAVGKNPGEMWERSKRMLTEHQIRFGLAEKAAFPLWMEEYGVSDDDSEQK